MTSRTKKKSSDDSWPNILAIVALLGLFAILMFAFRFVTIQSEYGVVNVDIPLVPASVDDPSAHNFEETIVKSVREHTTTVVLTLKSFYFGNITAFSSDLDDNGNKFIVPHIDNQPMTGILIEELAAWRKYRKERSNIFDDRILVFMPSGDIPMPIVIQVIDQLKKSGDYDHVILGGGLTI